MADPVVHITAGVPDSGTGNITTLGQTLLDGANATLGVTTGAAVTTDAAGTFQQYLRGLVALCVSGLKLAAGGNEIGRVATKHIIAVGSTMTRATNLTGYGNLDSISNSATAGSVTANTVTISDVNDDPVDITEILLDSTETAFGGVLIRLHVFNSDPTASSGVVAGDNVPWSNKRAGWIGSYSGLCVGFSDGMRATLISDGAPVRISGVETGGKRLWWQLQALGATAAPTASTTFIPTFKGYQGRL